MIAHISHIIKTARVESPHASLNKKNKVRHGQNAFVINFRIRFSAEIEVYSSKKSNLPDQADSFIIGI